MHGDIWECKYVLLALDEYYQWVDRDARVLQAMIDEVDATLEQVGLPPKTPIVELGWSSNRIESSTILEPILRLYRRTGYARFLEFAQYIVEVEGGAKGHRIFEEVRASDPIEVGGIYPKAYEMTSLFEGLAEYYRATGVAHWRETCRAFFRKVIEKEITIIAEDGFVAVQAVAPTRSDANMQPTAAGPILMVDYASVDSWEGKRVQTWLPMAIRRTLR
jgi:uncharacterized protein